MTKSLLVTTRDDAKQAICASSQSKIVTLVQLYLAETHLFDSSGMHPSTAPPIWAMVDAHWSGERCASAIRGEAVTEASHIGSFRPTQRSLNPSNSTSRHIHSDGLITGYMRLAAQLHNKPDRPPKFLEARTLSAASLATAFTAEITSKATPTKMSDICQ